MLCIIDEFSRESLAIRVARKLKATDVIEALCELFVSRGIPAHIRSDNGPEFVAETLWDWVAGARTAYIEPGSDRIARFAPEPAERNSGGIFVALSYSSPLLLLFRLRRF